ncbi:hypothetical protein PRIPAC_97712 [Pristionchus pacificus]|uniref:Uncharacterized protein n=1 Tax=Pristionchus pacificus TaxID=54126 RepID=A0A2A6CUP1_PRIPA|nr:hypothetical protein PRIPAC_97712 [Pristionchus pacificus]|eukprot:PDM81806.1 hypothetical protein PRIPAC_33960 [Pristionchus pacificus]
MSSFESHYESFHDMRSKIKSKLDAIESAITSLASVSNNDEIKALVISTSTIIVDVQLAVNQYEFAVSTLTAKIAEMDEENKKKEEQLFDQKMDTSITDGGNSIPVVPVSLTSLVREKKIHYDLTLAETINRVRVISSLSNDTVPVPTPAPPSIVPPLNSSVVSSVPNGSGDNLIASPLIDESAVIGKLSDSISQIITHISSSTSRPSLSLPPIKLETFDGSDLTRWPAFRYQIDQLVLKQPSLSEVEKAYHLRSSLKGNAFNLVASIPVHENFLNKIVSRLESQYGRHNLTQAKLIQSLRKIRSKSLLVTDQLSAVQSMISIAHSIHAESGVDALYVQQMLAECINPRFITFIGHHKPKTLLAGLELIENQLLTEHEETLTISAYSNGEDHRTTHNFDQPNTKAQRMPHQSIHSKNVHSPNPKTPRKPQCVFCGRHSFSGECAQVLSLKEKKEILRKKSLCHCCFSSYHSTTDCTRSCQACGAKHHKTMCDKSLAPRSGVNTITTDQSLHVNNRLFTAPVVITNQSATKCSMANVLLDTGAQTSLISRALANSLQLSPVGQLLVSVNGLQGAQGSSDSPSTHDVVQFDIITSNGKESIKALVRDTTDIVGSIHHPPLSSADLAVIKTTLSSIPSHFSDSTIIPDLLLGVGDTLRLLDSAKTTTLPCGYRLLQSVIGPIVAGSEQNASTMMNQQSHSDSINSKGRFSEINQQHSSTLRVASVVTDTEQHSLEQKIEHLFAVDPVAKIYETTERESRKVADEMVTKHFDDTVQLRDDGYYVKYALKPEVSSLPDNHDLAVSRLASTVRTLTKDHKLLKFYDSVIKDQLELGQVESVDPADTNGLVSNLYVDNIVINSDSPSSEIYTQSKSLFNSMAMNLRDYSSNDSSFMRSIPESDKSSDHNQKLLGLTWNVNTDQLSIKVPISKKSEKESKRSMCSIVASTYDPLGLLSPLLLPPRLTVQNLWNQPLKWDDPVDESIRLSFHKQINDLEKFTLPIDRFTHLSSSTEITLVAYSDASKHAMAACIYSWVPNRRPTLLISKTRLAPIKSTSTIPKMELDSLAMAHSLLLFTVETLRKEFPNKPINVYSFSDSAIVLHWIKPDFNKQLGVFVCNRIKLIQSMTESLIASEPLIYHHPRHVRSECNPADHATRGQS